MIDWMIQRLLDAPVRKHGLSLERRIDLCRSCVETLMPTVDDWIDAGARGKRCPNRIDVMAEELLSGPLIAVRLLRLLEQSFSDLLLYGHTRLPQAESLPYERRIHGKSMLPIFPTLSLWDRLIFRGISADAILMERAEPRKRHSDLYRQLQDTSVSKISLVLGAGNVSSVPFSDAIHKSLVCGHQVILKMNPVNAYLKPIFERAFAPLFQEGLLVAIEGDSQVGQALVDHPDVDDVHLTGSAHTHDRIVWGDDPQEILARKEAGTPRLTKPVTSELGNVSPWIIVPGVYSTKELTSQAMHLAASITNNAGFNCLATRVIVTCQNWPQRREFLRILQQNLQSIPKRPAYYPGALERYRRFTQTNIDPDDAGCLPYRLLESQSIDQNPLVFQEESFTCVCVETPLASQTASQFLDEAVALCNLRLPGTLCASVSFPKLFVEQKRRIISQALGTLRYGCVSVNQWSALAYSLLTPPWGGAPGASLEDAQSGIGQVHNTYLLERVEKTVLYGPLVNFPKPVWFPGHRNALRVGRELIGLYHQPSNYRLMKLFQHALIGS
jgi:Aldehyde dehydrogenase family